MNFELLPFQARAADQIARRHLLLASDPRRPLEHRGWATPFYQALGALTGSGKTPILADAVAQIRGSFTAEPVVLWISKSKAVVDQTFANFEPGGKYSTLLEGFTVEYLAAMNGERIGDDSEPFIAMTTVGAFNQKKKGEGTLKVHTTEEDTDNEPLWTLLGKRASRRAGLRRPLIVVYDEGHNLSDQQTELLLELEPDVILVASATMRTPGKLGRVIDRLREAGWSDDNYEEDEQHTSKGLVTAVRSKDAVEAGLVKRQIVLGGYATEMETALSDMLADLKVAIEQADRLDAGFTPKAIYVCKTNVSQEDGGADNPHRSFEQRKAPPILIWRYLVENGIDPASIAVYCDLRLDRRNFPPPESFNLFSGGEDDFAAFTAGDFKHIIFNLSLQEGWDDPACSFAYIDKSMGSAVQVEQVIGRVLRQPGARHYADPTLNTASFYIRIDSRQEFPKILEVVQRKIAAEIPEIRLDGFTDGRDRKRSRVDPSARLTIPEIHIDSSDAEQPLSTVISGIHDYTNDSGRNVEGKGELARALQVIGDGSEAVVEVREREHSNRVIARWLMRRAMSSMYPAAVEAVDWTDHRFEARIEMTSRAAASLRSDAERLVDVFLQHSELAFEEANPFTIPAVLIRPDHAERFRNAGHEKYSDLNPDEMAFAKAIDQTGLRWVRNQVNGGYSIPLLERGETRSFFPDFIVWKDDLIYLLDPKGSHLISRDAGRKLLSIKDERGRKRILVRLITRGRWSAEPIRQLSPSGFSVWRLGNGGQLRSTHHGEIEAVVKKCLDLT